MILEKNGGSGKTRTSDLTLISLLVVHTNLIPIGVHTTSVNTSVNILPKNLTSQKKEY